MDAAFVKKIMFGFMLAVLFSMSSCKDNDVREGEIVAPDDIEAETAGTTATDVAADTTSRIEEDSLIEAPSP